MPDLTWNKQYWDGAYDWQGRGEEWSQAWGGSESQWFGCLYPRLHRFLPVENVLEIAPGFGRWTHFLLRYVSGTYHGVDMSKECIAYCKDRFNAIAQTQFSVNDGLSLKMVKDGAFDLIFSFDSLVHAELDVHEVYIPQILRKLATNGVAFIHHSNWASANEVRTNTHCRGESVSAETFAQIVSSNGGHVIIQERVNWGTDKLIDCFTLFCSNERKGLKETMRIDNPHFMMEANILRDVHSKYCSV